MKQAREKADADLKASREKAVADLADLVKNEGMEAVMAAFIRTAVGPAEILLLSAHRATRDARKP